MKKIADRVVVVLKAAPTYLTALATLLTLIVALSPAGPVAAIATAAISAIGTAIVIIRRVTPVAEEARGLLPKETDAEHLESLWSDVFHAVQPKESK